MSYSAEQKFSPQLYARFAGFLYLVIIAAGIFAQGFVRAQMIVRDDASATATNILNAEHLFRRAFAGELALLISDVIVALILYVLLRPIDRNIALLAAFFRLVMTAISSVNGLNHFGVLQLLSGADYLSVFEPAQLNALSMLSLKMHALGYHVALVFFGVHCLLIGALLYRAEYLPKLIGLLMFIAGLSYLTNSFSAILAPEFAASISPQILLPALVAELSLALWLLILGVNRKRWRARLAAVET